MTEAIAVGPDRYTVPGNRWDLLPAPSRPPRVSVIVPYYDQQAQLERLLAGVALQRGPVEVTEVVVGDDGSPEPPRIPASYQGPPVHVVRQPDLGVRPAAARNLAATRATGDVYAFLDGDMVPGPDYLATVAAVAGVAPEALVVGTRHHHDLSGCRPEDVTAWLTGTGPAPPRLEDPEWLASGYEGSRHLLDLDHRSYQWVIGCVLTLAAPLFHELGGFDDSIDVYGGEDWDLAYRALHAGALLAHLDAVAHHDGPHWRALVGRNGTKNPERRAVAMRIPSLDDGILSAHPALLVELDATGWEPDPALATVNSLLRAGGGGVRVAASGLDPSNRRLLDPDPRVVAGPVHDPSRRCPLRCRVTAPIEVDRDTLRELLAATGPGTAGRVRLVDDEGTLLEAVSTRVRSRVARWSGHGLDADRLFGPESVLDAGPWGVRRLRPPLDLAQQFPR